MFNCTKKLSVALSMLIFGVLAASSAEASDLAVDYSYWNTSDGKAASGLMLHGAADVGTPGLQLEGRISYYDNISVASDPKITVLPVEAGARLHMFPGSMIDPYGSLGLGYYFFDGSSGFNVDNSWGGYAVLGSNFGMADMLGGFTINTELFYRYIKDASRDNFPDYDASGWGFNVGAGFHW